jgi:hypothetical protein
VFVNWDKRREVASWLDEHPAHVPAGWATREAIPPAAPPRPPDTRLAAVASEIRRSRLRARGVVRLLRGTPRAAVGGLRGVARRGD